MSRKYCLYRANRSVVVDGSRGPATVTLSTVYGSITSSKCWGLAFTGRDVLEPPGKSNAHSVLTTNYDGRPGTDTRNAYNELLQYHSFASVVMVESFP
jgi:hypothetical protein